MAQFELNARVASPRSAALFLKRVSRQKIVGWVSTHQPRTPQAPPLQSGARTTLPQAQHPPRRHTESALLVRMCPISQLTHKAKHLAHALPLANTLHNGGADHGPVSNTRNRLCCGGRFNAEAHAYR